MLTGGPTDVDGHVVVAGVGENEGVFGQTGVDMSGLRGRDRCDRCVYGLDNI